MKKLFEWLWPPKYLIEAYVSYPLFDGGATEFIVDSCRRRHHADAVDMATYYSMGHYGLPVQSRIIEND